MPDLARHIFFIGPRKTGTTTLYDVIKASGVRTPHSIKETFFFEQADISFADYKRKYALDPTEPFVEVSPSYFTNETARRNLRKHFPGAWVVITLRDPVKRCLSAISHIERIGLVNVADEIELGQFETNKHIRTLIATSHYEDYVDLWAADFPGRTIVMRQNDKGEFDPESLEQTARNCDIPLPVDAMLSTRSNSALTSLSPAFVKRVKRVMRSLDRIGLGSLRRPLKLLNRFFYRTAPPPDPLLEQRLEVLLKDSRAHYRARPLWNVR